MPLFIDTDLSLQITHRATRFNDNLDGTLTDLGPYIAAAAGDGRDTGGFAKPPLIVSKGIMSLTESPMVEPSLHKRALLASTPANSRTTRSQRHALSDQSTSEDGDSDYSDDKPLARARRSVTKPQLPPRTDRGRRLSMANPDRRYDEWLGRPELCSVSISGANRARQAKMAPPLT